MNPSPGDDARVLLAAVEVLRRRSLRPKSFGLAVMCGALQNTASRLLLLEEKRQAGVNRA